MKCKISLKNIKKYRKLKRYNQLRLAEEVGVSDATISRLENDRETSQKLDIIKKIGETLEVCPFNLMTCDIKKRKNGCKDCNRRYEE